MPRRGPKAQEPPPTPIPGRPEAPRGLTQEARDHYEGLVERLEEGGLLSRLDGDALDLYIAVWSRWQNALREVGEGGEVLMLNNGVVACSPWLRIAQESEKELRTLLGQLGLTPAARSRIKAGPKLTEADSKWDVFD